MKTFHSWWQDKLLRGVLKNTSYLFSSNSLSAALGMVNSIFVVRLLGVDGLGLVTTVQTFVSNVNRFLSFRMSEVVVKYLGQALVKNQDLSGEIAHPTEVRFRTIPSSNKPLPLSKASVFSKLPHPYWHTSF